jgi:hypothetical protein
MKFSHDPIVRNFSATQPAFARSSGRKSYFVRLVDVLHRFRRIQAERIITKSGHLVQDPVATKRET